MSVAPISAIPLFSGNFSLFRMEYTVKPVAISELSFLRVNKFCNIALTQHFIIVFVFDIFFLLLKVMKQLSLAGVWASEVEGKVGIEGPRGAVDIDWLGDLSKFVNSESLLAGKYVTFTYLV
jgi:hypothetical protein